MFVTLSIVSLVMVAVYSAFSSGLNVYNRHKKSILYNYKPYLLLERFSKDILNSPNFSKIPFTGNSASISFCGILDTGELGRLTYYLDEGSLYRKQESYPQLFTDAGVRAKELAKNISSLSISYYSLDPETNEHNWSSLWQETGAKPSSVRIELKVLKSPQDIPYEASGSDTFIKTVSLP